MSQSATIDHALPQPDHDRPWWRGAVLYQIYPRSFRDSNGDGIGDLPGIVAGLDHIASLGVDGIWISPFFTSPMRDFGYDVSDYCGIDPTFGTFEDFDAIIAKAHALGLKVIIDQVYSHTSDLHPWFEESRADRTNPKADWYVWADPRPDGSPPSNWQSVFGGSSWQWDGPRKQYYLHNFLTSQPDLNLHNREVQDAILDVARFWLDRGVDGFRLDALNFSMHDPALRDNPPSGWPMERITRPFDMQRHTRSMSHPDVVTFLERLAGVIREYHGRFTVAEVGGPDPLAEMKAFTDGDHRLNSAYNFDFLYAKTIDADWVQRAVSQWTGEPGEGWPSWAFSNHDAPRAVTRWAPPEMRDRMARTLLLLLIGLRGNPFIYQGDELGLPQGEVAFEDLKDPEAIANWPHTLGRDGARTPLPWSVDAPYGGFTTGTPWLALDKAHAPLAIDVQERDPGSVLHFTRTVLSRRRSLPALIDGDMDILLAEGPLFVFRRTAGGDEVIGLFNLGGDAVPLPDTLALSSLSVAASTDTPAGSGDLPSSLPGHSGYWAVRAERAVG